MKSQCFSTLIIFCNFFSFNFSTSVLLDLCTKLQIKKLLILRMWNNRVKEYKFTYNLFRDDKNLTRIYEKFWKTKGEILFKIFGGLQALAECAWLRNFHHSNPIITVGFITKDDFLIKKKYYTKFSWRFQSWNLKFRFFMETE